MALLIVGSSIAADGFTATRPQHQRLSTRRYFVEDTVAIKTQDMLTNALQPQSGKLPTWLRQPKAHLYEQNVSKLRDAMLNSFFSENEILKLMHAIREVSGGDRNKMAGAAEFCLVLVETTEMGLSALLAAAFHFCSCVTAREQSLLLPFGASPSDLWDHKDYTGLSSFGDEHAVAIARDAASLKRLEMVATEIMQSPRKSVRVVPDARDSENLQRLLLTESKDWRALAIRSAACLYRMRGIQKSLAKGDLSPEAVRVAREAIYIFAPQASRLGMHRLKNELEGTAFKLLYRRQYETVTSLSREFRFKNFGRTMTRPAFSEKRNDEVMDIAGSMQRVLDDVTEDVREMLRSDPDFSSMAENVSVTARVKEPYSMWKKMLRDKAGHILQVPDALALRIVFDAQKSSEDEDTELTRAKERALCYYVRELCTARWKPQPGNPRFKDYIERPKTNGYQSLHYTAITNWGGKDWTMEIQIRSGEMHRVAEYGLASHWDYKAQWKNRGDTSREERFSDAYLRSLQEWHWQHHSGRKQWNMAPSTTEGEGNIRADRIRARTEQLAPYIEALSEAQSNMALEHVFVFLSHSQDTMYTEGKVVALPAGACVLDALRHGEKTLGLRLNWREERSLVSRNGSMSNLTQKLKNGDVLTVP